MRHILSKLWCALRGHTGTSLHRVGYGGCYVTKCARCGEPFHLLRVLLLLACLRSDAATFTVIWDPSANAVNYELRLAWGTNAVTATTSVAVYTFTNLINGQQYQINATAISAQGVRSDPSTNFFVPVPGQPNNLRVSMLLESAPEPAGPWTTQSNVTMYVATSDPNRFYRGRMVIHQQ